MLGPVNIFSITDNITTIYTLAIEPIVYLRLYLFQLYLFQFIVCLLQKNEGI